LLAKGFLSESSHLYDHEQPRLNEYVSDLARLVGTDRLNGPYRPFLNNKLAFHWMMEAFTARVVRAYGLIGSEWTSVFSKGEPPEPPPDAREWLSSLLSGRGKLVIKPLQGSGGKGVQVVNSLSQLESLEFGGDELLVTDFVEQHDYAKELFPGATNTIRVLALQDDNGPFVATAIHRIGTSLSAPADNWGGGGISVGIDRASGSLLRGAQHPKRTGGRLVWLERHPETSAPFYGIAIPGWREVIHELMAITRRMPFLPYIGWDVVVTEDGFKIIEGNSRSDVNLLQIHGPLLVDERVKRFFKKHEVV
jgi:hypothetical protein